MKNFKRIALLLLVTMTMLFGISGCTDDVNNASNADTNQENTEADSKSEETTEADSKSEEATEADSKSEETTMLGMIVVSKYKSYNSFGDTIDYSYIVYDKETYVMYYIVAFDGYKSGGLSITPLYNADGTLKTYSPEE